MIRTEPTPRQQFIIVFSDRLHMQRRWYHIFLRPGFFHVYLMREAKAGTIFFQPMLRTWILDWRPQDTMEIIGELLRDGRFRVLVMDRPGDGVYYRFGPIHCVNVVKACLGIKSRAFTPFQLYRDLLQMGAIELKP